MHTLIRLCLITDLIAGVDLAAQENSIRELINLEAPLRTVLRLLCMYSLVAGGIKQKVLEEFKRDVLQVRPRFAGRSRSRRVDR
jgi:hypothetical protein